jgi:hypothetical protein
MIIVRDVGDSLNFHSQNVQHQQDYDEQRFIQKNLQKDVDSLTANLA